MPRAPRRLAAAGLAVGSALALAACGTAHPGAAAVIGGHRITTAQLDALTSRSLADPTFAKATTDMAALRTSKLQNLLTHQLLTDAAAEQGLTVSEAELQTELHTIEQGDGSAPAQTDAQIFTEAAHGGVAREDVNQILFDLVARSKLEAKITTPVVHAAHILVKDKATADAILGQVKADPSQFAALAKTKSIDTGSAPRGGDLGTAPAVSYVAPFAAAVSKAAVGSYFVVQSSFGWHVVHLISRTAETVADLAKAATTQAQFDLATAALNSYLGGVGEKVGVSLNPRYGTWDATAAAITAAPNAFSSQPPSAPASALASPSA